MMDALVSNHANEALAFSKLSVWHCTWRTRFFCLGYG